MPDAQDSKIANVDRLHAYMDRNNLAAVVARSGRNFTYLSGIAYPGTLARLLDLTRDIMTKSIGALLSSAAHGVVRGLAVVSLVVAWSVSHVGTYALSVVGVSSALLTTTATPADAQYAVIAVIAVIAVGGGEVAPTPDFIWNRRRLGVCLQ